MNRRGFFGALVAAVTAPLTVKLVAPVEPLKAGWWSGYVSDVIAYKGGDTVVMHPSVYALLESRYGGGLSAWLPTVQVDPLCPRDKLFGVDRSLG